MNRLKYPIMTLALALTLLAGVFTIVPDITAPAETVSAQSDGNAYADVYRRVAPSVVSIVVDTGETTVFGTPATASGTGFVVDSQGNILTNYHVVQGATDITVEFFDGTLIAATIVGEDPESDLAVINVNVPAQSLVPVQFADSNVLFVGQPVAAIGSPFRQEWTMTTGIVSAVNRTVTSLGEYRIGGVVQTDAAINPGNSGGPLVDLDGRVIGVNVQILSSAGVNSGVGFAIPSNLAQRVYTDLVDDGEVNYAFIGISPIEVNLSFIELLNLPNNTRGVWVNEIVDGSGAANSGLREAGSFFRGPDGFDWPREFDLITAIDGRPIRDFETLISYLSANTLPGDTVTLTVLRNGTEQINIDVTLTNRPAQQ